MILAFLKINSFIFGCPGSRLLCGLFSSCGKRGLLSSCNAWASHWGWLLSLRAWALGTQVSVVMAHRLHCFVACGIFPSQEWIPCLQHCQMDFSPMSCRGSLMILYFNLILSPYLAISEWFLQGFWYIKSFLELQHWISFHNLYRHLGHLDKNQGEAIWYLYTYCILSGLHIASECFLLNLLHISNQTTEQVLGFLAFSTP